MKTCIICSAFMLLSLSLTGQRVDETQAWTSSDGMILYAKYIRMDGDAVVVEKDGKSFTVPFAKLTPESVELARKLKAGSVPATIRLINLSGEPRIKQDEMKSSLKFSSKDNLTLGLGKVQFKFEAENLTTNPLINVRFVISVLDKTTAVNKQGKLKQGFSVKYMNGGSLDAKKKTQYSGEVMISFDEKSKRRPIDAYSIDVFADRKLLLTQTYPPTAQKKMDEMKAGSDAYKKWSGGLNDNRQRHAK